jgi:two-component system, NtrC family, sensor kinase
MKYLKISLLLISILFINVFGFAQQIVYNKGSIAQSYIGKKVYLYQDSTSKLTFSQIKNRPELFKLSTATVPNLGVSSNNNWIKFSLINNSDSDKVILNLSNPIIDRVSLYIIRGNKIDSAHYTNFQPLAHRDYKHQFYLFDIPLKKGEAVECYISLNSNQQILAPISLSSEKQILSQISQSDIRAGLYIGIMLVMLLYNLFIFFAVRDRDYIVYCHYIFWVTLTQATLLGYSHRFLWPNNTWLSQNMLILCGAMSGIATILFAKSFLRTKKFVPKFSVVLDITIAIYVISIALLLSGNSIAAFQVVNMNAALVSILIIFVAWAVFRKKYAPASYFLLSWSIFFISILVFVSKDFGVVPYNEWTVHAVEIGSALEAIFLSFALAGKINILKKEKEASQAEALEIAKENERIIREQNVVLEAKVKERTSELESSNSELNTTLVDLKQAQMQLVESEKMASLGQLTAGIAHEINNPINFVTSNVAPLQRDVDILMDAIRTMEDLNFSDAPMDDKKKQIEEYKEEIDYDYLKIEISHLLKGINEGASRTADIVKGLRVFSRLDEDDLKLADIHEGIESTLVIANNLLNGIKVTKQFSELPTIECYPGKLNQVFLNIISNATHAINKRHKDAADGEIIIKTHCNEEHVFIEISDNGTGMDENAIKKIFEPFFTTKDVGEGTGLGMSIAYNTIKKHNGQINLKSEMGRGTNFIIDLPIINVKISET